MMNSFNGLHRTIAFAKVNGVYLREGGLGMVAKVEIWWIDLAGKCKSIDRICDASRRAQRKHPTWIRRTILNSK